MRKGVIYTVIVLLVLAAVMTGCGGTAASSPSSAGASAGGPDPSLDLDRIKDSGVLVVGITDYAPMDYLENGEWTGLDAELSRLFADWLGVEAVFKEIDWGQKIRLLQSGEIDCIWNGMTRTDEMAEAIDISAVYCSTAEVVLLPKKLFEKYDTAEKSYHLLFAVEDGSSAQSVAQELKLRTIAYPNQLSVMEAVLKKKCDAAIVDRVNARIITAEGAEYEDLEFGFPFYEEEICVGLRKGSSLTSKLNEFFSVFYKDGTITEIAERYGLAEDLRLGQGN